MQPFWNVSSKGSILTRENSTPLIYLSLKWDFLNFPLFPSFPVGSIAQNENTEMLEMFKSLKTLNFLCQAPKEFT